MSYGSFLCYFELVLKPSSRLSHTPGCWKSVEINNCNLNLLCFLQSKVRGPVTGSPESMNTSRLSSPGQLLLQVPSGTYNLSESVRKRSGKVWTSVAANSSMTKLGLLLCEITTRKLSCILRFVFSSLFHLVAGLPEACESFLWKMGNNVQLHFPLPQ